MLKRRNVSKLGVTCLGVALAAANCDAARALENANNAPSAPPLVMPSGAKVFLAGPGPNSPRIGYP
jgi:hypothetical protein